MFLSFSSLIVAILYVESALIIPSVLTALILLFSESENPQMKTFSGVLSPGNDPSDRRCGFAYNRHNI